jgi:hypothetical protein
VRALLAITALAAVAGAARADTPDDKPDKDAPKGGETTEQLVLLNASARLASFGQLDRIARVLDQRRMLVHLPENLQAALDGRNSQVADFDQIHDAYVAVQYDAALRLIDADEQRLLKAGAGSDLLPALAQLSLWRGLIAVGEEKNDEAVEWFRAAYRFNPAQEPDKRLTPQRIRLMIKKARHEPEQTGKLRVDASPDTALVQIDGAKADATDDRIELPIGTHLVQVSAEGLRPYAELVDIKDGKTERVTIALEPATKSDRAAKVVEATVAAPPGPARLKSAAPLTKLTGASRILVIEDGTVLVLKDRHETRWYEHWYVWAAAAAVVGGGVLGYELAHRDPSSLRGF